MKYVQFCKNLFWKNQKINKILKVWIFFRNIYAPSDEISPHCCGKEDTETWNVMAGEISSLDGCSIPSELFFFVVSRAEQIRQATKRCWCHFGCGIFSSRKINWNKSPCWNSFSFYPFWKDWWPQARLTQPDWTLFWFKYIWTRPQGYQGCQNNWKDTRSIILMCSCPKYLAQIEQTSKNLIKSRKSIKNDCFVTIRFSPGKIGISTKVIEN